MKLKIKVTRDILHRSMMRGRVESQMVNGQNCAIALACREIFPTCFVNSHNICSDKYVGEKMEPVLSSEMDWFIPLPTSAVYFIEKFDITYPSKDRLELPLLEFEVELNENVLRSINIDQAREAIKYSETLELVEAR